MFGNLQIFLLWLTATAALYALLPCERPRLRQFFLIFASFLLIYALAPIAAATALAVSAGTIFWCRLWLYRRGPWLLALAVGTLLAPLVILKAQAELNLAVTLGIGFVALKSIATMIDAYQRPARTDIASLLLLNFFAPIYSAGPVERAATFATASFARPITVENLLHGTLRIAIGLFKAAFLADALIRPTIAATWPRIATDPGLFDPAAAFGFVLASFLYTYVNFSGYMDIAIGAGRLFSITVMENFNAPFLARNIQDFWRRWHISLGNFIMQYVFFPTVATLRRAWGMQVAVILAFFLVGLWHEFSVNYIAWGLLHGLGLATVQTVRQWGRRRPFYERVSGMVGYKLCAWALTLFYVAWVQTIANLPDGQAALGLSLRLLGF